MYTYGCCMFMQKPGGYSGIIQLFLHKNSGALEHTYHEINFSSRYWNIRIMK